MNKCQHCHSNLMPLARYCGSCGKATGFDVEVLKESAEKNIHHKTKTSKKRKGLAWITFAMFVSIIVLVVVFTVVSYLLEETFAALLFIIAGLTFLVYFKEKSKHLHSLIKVSAENRCLTCGSILHEHEIFCEQCGQKIK